MTDKLSIIRENIVSIMMDAADRAYHHGFGQPGQVAARMVQRCQEALMALEDLEDEQ